MCPVSVFFADYGEVGRLGEGGQGFEGRYGVAGVAWQASPSKDLSLLVLSYGSFWRS